MAALAETRRVERELAQAERAAFDATLGDPPAEMSIIDATTGKAQVFRVPKMRPRRRR